MGTKQFDSCEPHTFWNPILCHDLPRVARPWPVMVMNPTTAGSILHFSLSKFATLSCGPAGKTLVSFCFTSSFSRISSQESADQIMLECFFQDRQLQLASSFLSINLPAATEKAFKVPNKVCVPARSWCAQIWGLSWCDNAALRLQSVSVLWSDAVLQPLVAKQGSLCVRERESELLMCANALRRNWVPGCRQHGGHTPTPPPHPRDGDGIRQRSACQGQNSRPKWSFW